MRTLLALLCSAALSCTRTPPAPSLVVEAEVHTRAKDPSSQCALSGEFHFPRAESQRISGGTDWKGTATVRDGDVVVVAVDVVGAETWSCELECSLHQVGARISTTSKSEATASRPAPTCPTGHRQRMSCVIHAGNPTD